MAAPQEVPLSSRSTFNRFWNLSRTCCIFV